MEVDSSPTVAGPAARSRPTTRECPQCRQSVPYSQYARHLRARHGVGEWKHVCPECARAFPRSDHLTLHIAVYAPEHQCGRCDFTTKKADVLQSHASTHATADLQRRLEESVAQADAVRAQLEQRDREVAALQQQLDDARAAQDDGELALDGGDGGDGGAGGADGAAGAAGAARAGRRRSRGGAGRCACGVLDRPELMGPVVRCISSRCGARFHFGCAGYMYQLTNHGLALCRECLDAGGHTAGAVERADNELRVLDDRLAALRLRRISVDGDGLCYFRAVAASLGEDPTELLRMAMVAVAAREWEHLSADDRDAVRQRATALSQRSLRMGERWDNEAMDLAIRILPSVSGRPVVLMELADGRTLRCQDENGVAVSTVPETAIRVCVSHRSIRREHYNAVVPR